MKKLDRRIDRLAPPTTQKVDVADVLHGIEVADPYRWLEENDTPEVQEWLEQQAAYTEALLSEIPVREELRMRFRKLYSLDTVGVPSPKQGRYFFSERKGDQDMAVLYVQEGPEGPPRILIDPNTLSKNKTTTLRASYPSRDGRLLAYTLSEQGNDQAAIYVMDVDTGENLSDKIPADLYPAVYSPVTWSKDGGGFWYTRHAPDGEVTDEERKFYQRVFYHKLGTDWQKDPFIFGKHLSKEDTPWVELSEDGRYLLATVWGASDGHEWCELYLQSRRNPEWGFVPVVRRVPGAKSFGALHHDTLFIMTDDGAPHWQIMAIGIEEAIAGATAPKTVIPEGEGVIKDFDPIGDRLFVHYLEDVHSVLREYRLDGTLVKEIPLPTFGSIGGLSYEREGNELFFSFVSFAVPPTIFRLDLATQTTQVFKKMEAGIDLDTLATEQVWYDSKDGTCIPMFLIYRKGLVRNGDNPTVLYGYGGFDISVTPFFMKSIMPFIERGGVFAIANIRGGGEFGKEWHEAGMRKQKQNVFDDFIAAAEWLIAEGYTNSERLAIYGGSNGGLLVAAVMTQRPNLVKAVMMSVPVADMLRYHLFFGGRHWIPDYGSTEEEDMLPYLLAYSPYHNVRDGEQYPATIIITSDNDDRVHPMHSYKMTARLQEATASNNPILLRVELKAGHGGATAISKFVIEYTDMWSFVFQQLGLTDDNPTRSRRP